METDYNDSDTKYKNDTTYLSDVVLNVYIKYIFERNKSCLKYEDNKNGLNKRKYIFLEDKYVYTYVYIYFYSKCEMFPKG